MPAATARFNESTRSLIGYVGTPTGDRLIEVAQRRLVDEHGLHPIAAVLDHTAHDLPSFRDEQPARSRELAVAQTVIPGDARIVFAVDALDGHVSP